jgi:hypothetical protein
MHKTWFDTMVEWALIAIAVAAVIEAARILMGLSSC